MQKGSLGAHGHSSAAGDGGGFTDTSTIVNSLSLLIYITMNELIWES